MLRLRPLLPFVLILALPHDDLPLFAFGTLRRGKPNHGYLAGRYLTCLPGRVAGFRRAVAGHGFPAMSPSPASYVDGEVFTLDPATQEETLRNCDLLEDLPPGELVGEFYRRAKVFVTTPEGVLTAWAYVDPATPVDEAQFATASAPESRA